ncbi:MAG: hypothetical protein ACRDT8_05180 [Micromonosporaceae bacterium]
MLPHPNAVDDVVAIDGVTPSDLSSARRTLAHHRRQRYPRGRQCGWCRDHYPCPPRRAAESFLRSLDTGRNSTTGAAVPGLSSRQRQSRSTVAQAQLMLLHTHH